MFCARVTPRPKRVKAAIVKMKTSLRPDSCNTRNLRSVSSCYKTRQKIDGKKLAYFGSRSED
jgi:hypothetical protein